MTEDHHIFLVGYMASGKTITGKQLAECLNRPFIDLDQHIEARAGMSISEIFAQHGEPAFRKMEHEALTDCIKGAPSVIATGGGTPTDVENMRLMKLAGVVVYLEVPLAVLVERLLADRAQRPILSGLNDDQVADFISHHLESRTAAYGQANLKFNATEPVSVLCENLADYSK